MVLAIFAIAAKWIIDHRAFLPATELRLGIAALIILAVAVIVLVARATFGRIG